MVYVVFSSSWEHSHIIKVYHHALSNDSVKGDIHATFKCCAYVYKPKQHSSIRERTLVGMERSFESVRFFYQNLIVSWETIKEIKHLFPRYCFQNMVHGWHEVVVFVRVMVYVLEINTQADFPRLVSYRNKVGDPCRISNFVYDLCTQQLSKLFLYEGFKQQMYFP